MSSDLLHVHVHLVFQTNCVGASSTHFVNIMLWKCYNSSLRFVFNIFFTFAHVWFLWSCLLYHPICLHGCEQLQNYDGGFCLPSQNVGDIVWFAIFSFSFKWWSTKLATSWFIDFHSHKSFIMWSSLLLNLGIRSNQETLHGFLFSSHHYKMWV